MKKVIITLLLALACAPVVSAQNPTSKVIKRAGYVAGKRGDIFVNSSTGVTYMCKSASCASNGTGWASMDAGSAGDASGPASSTDNAVARFDGAGGKTLQNSPVTVGDAGEVAGVGNITFGATNRLNPFTGYFGVPGLANIEADGTAGAMLLTEHLALGLNANDAGAVQLIANGSGLRINMQSSFSVCWTNTAGTSATTLATSQDTCVQRSAAGVVEINNGTTGEYRDLRVRNVFMADTPQTLTGAGAVNLTTYSTLIVTTGANALTLAAGAEGQHKFIRMKTDGGDGTLTVTNLQGGTTITFNDAGDFVLLFYQDAKWHILTNSGCTVA